MTGAAFFWWISRAEPKRWLRVSLWTWALCRCIVILGMARYAIAAGDKNAYILQEASWFMFQENRQRRVRTLPYPLSDQFRAPEFPWFSAIPPGDRLAAEIFDPDACLNWRKAGTTIDILTNFTDDNLIHEVISSDSSRYTNTGSAYTSVIPWKMSGS